MIDAIVLPILRRHLSRGVRTKTREDFIQRPVSRHTARLVWSDQLER